MRRALLIAALAVLALLGWLFGAGGMDAVSAWAAAGQEQAQRAMAGALRALRAGQPGALAGLWGLCFTYGFFHAAGPGHGKILIGGYGLGADVPLGRLSALALAASLAQGLTAVALVGAGMALLGMGRQDMIGAAESWFAPVSYGAIALVGLWLAARGLRGLSAGWSLAPAPAVTADGPPLTAPGHAQHHNPSHHHHHPHSHDAHVHGHGHGHGHEHGHDDGVCATCGHAHGPSLAQARAVTGWRDAAALVGAIALRPCTGAVFVLILTFRWGLVWQGVTAVLAMALGVAAVTVAVGLAAVTLREGALRRALARLSGGGAARAMHAVEASVGALVAVIALGLLLRAL
jgi:ABC-type nickel/cobalt efflux system permease component RcnA